MSDHLQYIIRIVRVSGLMVKTYLQYVIEYLGKLAL